MDVSRPHGAVASGIDTDVLVALARTTRPLTGRRVAELVGHSQRGVLAALDRFVDQGLVTRTAAGRAFMHELNRDHLAAPAVELLAGMRGEFLQRLRNTFAGWDIAAAHASMFGSAARGNGDAGSDIDLLVVRPSAVDEDDAAWRSQLEELTQAIEAWTGNHAVLIEQSESDMADLRRSKRRGIVSELRSDAIDLFGPSVHELLGNESS
jgi:predicted nucleotidyltransferase